MQIEQRERVASLEEGLAEIVAIAEAATSDAVSSYGAAVESLQVQLSTRVFIYGQGLYISEKFIG